MRPTSKLLLVFIVIANSTLLCAQQKLLKFYVLNAQTATPVQEVFVTNSETAFSTTSNQNGLVSIPQLPAAATQLTMQCVGYVPQTVLVATLLAMDTPVVYLTAGIARMQDVQVKALSRYGVFNTISNLDMHLRPLTNAQEVLRMVPGLFIGQHAGGGKAEQIFLRGFDIDHGTDVNLTVDGMPVNMASHAHGQGFADLHWVMPELVDKVNFSKGPYFAEKGNFTTAGFVDFKTKNFLDRNFVQLEGGQYNHYRAVAAVNLLPRQSKRPNGSLYLAGEALYNKGFFDNPQHLTRFNGMLKYHGQVGNNSQLTAAITGFNSKWNASGQIPERAVNSGLIDFFGAVDPTEGGTTSRYNANLEWSANLHNGARLTNQVYYTRYAFELYSNFTFFKEDPVNSDQIRQKETRNIAGYNGSYSNSFFIGSMSTETTAGIQWRYDDVNDIELTRTKNRTQNLLPVMFGNIREMNVAAYWSQRFSVTKKLDVTAALRADYFSNKYFDKLHNSQLAATSAIVSPKLHFNYRINNHLQLYLYNGRGFHSNDTRVAVQQQGNKVLPPAFGTDVGGIFKINKNLVVQAALWYLWLQQEFIYVGDEGIVEPGGKTRRYGADLSVRYEVLKHLFFDTDVNLARPRLANGAKNNSYLPLAPLLTSAGGLAFKKQNGFNGSLRYRFMGNRPANQNYSVVARGYCVTDAAIYYTQPQWKAGVTIQNLLNTRWKETQFETESQLQHEPSPVSEIHFTPGTPLLATAGVTFFF